MRLPEFAREAGAASFAQRVAGESPAAPLWDTSPVRR